MNCINRLASAPKRTHDFQCTFKCIVFMFIQMLLPSSPLSPRCRPLFCYCVRSYEFDSLFFLSTILMIRLENLCLVLPLSQNHNHIMQREYQFKTDSFSFIILFEIYFIFIFWLGRKRMHLSRLDDPIDSFQNKLTFITALIEMQN